MSLKEKVVTSSVEEVSLYLLEKIKELKSKDEDLSYSDKEQQKVQVTSECGNYVATLDSNGKGAFYELVNLDEHAFRYEHVGKPEDIKDIKWAISKDIDYLNSELPIGDIVIKVGYVEHEDKSYPNGYHEILKENSTKGYEPILSGTLKDKIIEIQKVVNTVTRVKPTEFEVLYTGLSTGEIKEPIVLYYDFVKASQDALKSSIDKDEKNEVNIGVGFRTNNCDDCDGYCDECEYEDEDNYCDVCGCEIDLDYTIDYICEDCEDRDGDDLVTNPYRN